MLDVVSGSCGVARVPDRIVVVVCVVFSPLLLVVCCCWSRSITGCLRGLMMQDCRAATVTVTVVVYSCWTRSFAGCLPRYDYNLLQVCRAAAAGFRTVNACIGCWSAGHIA